MVLPSSEPAWLGAGVHRTAWIFKLGCFPSPGFFLVGVSSVYGRIEEEGDGCARGKRAGSGSQVEEEEEATGSDREDC